MRLGVVARLWAAVAGLFFDRIFGARAVTVAPPPSAAGTRVIFQLSLKAGDAAGSVLNMSIRPMLKPVAAVAAIGDSAVRPVQWPEDEIVAAAGARARLPAGDNRPFFRRHEVDGADGPLAGEQPAVEVQRAHLPSDLPIA